MKIINLPPYFVVRAVQKGDKLEVLETVVANKDGSDLDELANQGVGSINYIVGTISVVDRLTPPPADIAEEAIKFLQEVVKGRRHSSSPQCLPTAQYRRLAELAEQYARAQELQKRGEE